MKKKLLIFHQHDTCVGAGLCLIQIVQALKKNYDITVCLPKNGGNLNNLLIKEKIKTIYISSICHHRKPRHLFIQRPRILPWEFLSVEPIPFHIYC